jgi:hypothetical protein
MLKRCCSTALGSLNIAELSVEFVEPPESNHLHFNRPL